MGYHRDRSAVVCRRKLIMSPKAFNLLVVLGACAVYVGVSFVPGDMEFVRNTCMLVVGWAGFPRLGDRK